MTTGNILPSGRPQIDHLDMKGIVKRFPGVVANDQVDFDLRAGEVHALLGENGAGKSTLMSMLAGQSQPDSGTIYINGAEVVFSSTEKAIEAGIGMVYQHFKLVDSMTVAENVGFGLQMKKVGKSEMADRVQRTLDMVQLGHRADATPKQLSGGQEQRVAIASPGRGLVGPGAQLLAEALGRDVQHQVAAGGENQTLEVAERETRQVTGGHNLAGLSQFVELLLGRAGEVEMAGGRVKGEAAGIKQAGR